ncbi:YceI family protein [Aridibaculum aurantiacum]|uniref:YceI family protein n=1 Tax=Aridibaculum aurantiacum TaxID=2810307 RepID=UPI001A978B71|nr:YceI family protein [Aridibaculum aurantiacum]
MKKILFPAALVAMVAVSCTQAPDADKAATSEQREASSPQGTVYTIDTAASKVTWVGTKVNGQHNGTFSLSNGTIGVSNGTISSGTFTINVASIVNEDLKDETNGQLVGHLKSADFFDVEKYPTASFEITKVEPYDSSKTTSKLEGATHIVSGNLTLKNETKNVTFPAKVSVNDNTVTAQANFQIDRTEWGMNYKGPNNPQDWFIRKEVNIGLDITARK